MYRMRYIYKVRKDILETEDGERCTVYGIDIIQNSKIIKSVGDLFFDKESAENFAKLCHYKNIPPEKVEKAASQVLDRPKRMTCSPAAEK